jgi:hypothetical protein
MERTGLEEAFLHLTADAMAVEGADDAAAAR